MSNSLDALFDNTYMFFFHISVIIKAFDNIVTFGLKARTCASVGRSYARHVLVVTTKYTVTLDSDGAFGDISMVTHF
jgi:hypothetical protein